jgi:hypothetical protein
MIEAAVMASIMLTAIGVYFLSSVGMIVRKSQPILSLFCTLGSGLCSIYWPFRTGDCLKGMVWGDCPVCPHISIWQCIGEYTSGATMALAYIFVIMSVVYTVYGAFFCLMNPNVGDE